jgi:hypothetical protein
MTISSAVLLGITLVCLGFVVRNFLGQPSRFGIITGWVTMLVFASLAAYFCWKGRELRLARAPAELVGSATGRSPASESRWWAPRPASRSSAERCGLDPRKLARARAEPYDPVCFGHPPRGAARRRRN